MAAAEPIYKVVFLNQGQVYEIHARSVGQGDLFGFVEIGQLVFGEKSSIVIDPTEDRLRNEFSGVGRTYIPLHSIVRIDQVDKPGVNRIAELEQGEGTVTPFPGRLYTPIGDREKS